MNFQHKPCNLQKPACTASLSTQSHTSSQAAEQPPTQPLQLSQVYLYCLSQINHSQLYKLLNNLQHKSCNPPNSACTASFPYHSQVYKLLINFQHQSCNPHKPACTASLSIQSFISPQTAEPPTPFPEPSRPCLLCPFPKPITHRLEMKTNGTLPPRNNPSLLAFTFKCPLSLLNTQ